MNNRDLELLCRQDDFIFLNRIFNVCRNCGGTGKVHSNTTTGSCPDCLGEGIFDYKQ